MKARMQKNQTLELGPLRSRYKEENNNDDISVIKSVKSDASLTNMSRNVINQKKSNTKNLININVMEPTTMNSG